LHFAAPSCRGWPTLASLLQRTYKCFQFAPGWTKAHLEALGAFRLKPEHHLVVRQDGTIAGAIAVWDQRATRQTMGRRSPRWFARCGHF
jgi:hypothetical protein